MPDVIEPASSNTGAASTSANNQVTTGSASTAAGTTSSGNTPTTSVYYENNGAASTTSSTATPAPDPGTLKTTAPTKPIPNPLHQFASYTYKWSLWWLGMDDANAILEAPDVGTGIHHPMTLGKSFCIAEDGGIYPQYRAPSQYGLNYNIQDVTFDSTVGLNTSTKSTNMSLGTLSIIEPYGVTFLNTVIAMSYNPELQKYENYLQQPFMLQLDFVGYDDKGEPLPQATSSVYRKRFPITLTKMGMKVTNRGTEYNISYATLTQLPHHNRHSTTRVNFDIVAGTVGEFFTNFSQEMNAYFQQQKVNGKIQWADTMSFDVDPVIWNSDIVYSTQVSLAQSNPKGKNIDLTKGNFSIPAGTKIMEVIEKVLLQSKYIVDQLGLDVSNPQIKLTAAQSNKFNYFKTVCRTTYYGADGSGNLKKNAFDSSRNVRPVRYTYNIHQYPVIDAHHPTLPPFIDPSKNTVKVYNYIYTGRNVDIINLNIDFNTTFYTDVAAYISQMAADNTTQSTAVYDALDSNRALSLFPTPEFYAASGIAPSLGQIPNPTPLMLHMQVNDRRENLAFNILENPGAQAAVNVSKSLYSRWPSGDMIMLDLTIVGDPTLIKQDDVLYAPSPTKGTQYNNWTTQSQEAFAQQHGHIRMDSGELVCYVNISTPLDLDIDAFGGNKGLVYPQQGQYPSLFNGYYRILQIKNQFKNGQFTQVLKLTRHQHSSYTQAGAGTKPEDRPRAGGDGTWSI